MGHILMIFWCFCALNPGIPTFLTTENTSSSILLVFIALLSHLPPVTQNKIALAITTCQIKALVSWWPISYFLESGKQFFPNQVGENDDYLDNSLYCQILFFQTTMLSSCWATNTNLIQRKSGFRSERGEHSADIDQQKETNATSALQNGVSKDRRPSLKIHLQFQQQQQAGEDPQSQQVHNRRGQVSRYVSSQAKPKGY